MHPNAEILHKFYRPCEVAEILGTHRTTVFRWARSGVLPKLIYLTPKRAVFVRSEIEAWLADRAGARGATQAIKAT